MLPTDSLLLIYSIGCNIMVLVNDSENVMKKDYALGISRLQRLVQHLNTIDKTNLNMWSWVESDVFHENPPEFLTAEDIDCGTTCCAFGHAATIPEFVEAGLRLVKIKSERWAGILDASGGYTYTVALENQIPDVESIDGGYLEVLRNAVDFFALDSTDQAEYIFGFDDYFEDGPVLLEDVIKHIRIVADEISQQAEPTQ